MVSVCVATYNGAKYIKQQLQSILLQLQPDDEIIISDDDSTDDTVTIIKSLEDERITIYSAAYRSPIKNFENALSKAKGEFIFMSDQDDIWLPGRIEKALNQLVVYDIVVNDVEIIDENGSLIAPSLFKEINSGSGFLKNMISNTYYGCCMCFRRRVVLLALPFPNQIPMHDIWLGFVAELFFKTNFCDDRLVQYRRHSQNVTQFKKSTSSFVKKIEYRVNLIRYLPLLILRWYRNKR